MKSTQEITAPHAAELRSSAAAPLANLTDLANIQHPSRLLARSLAPPCLIAFSHCIRRATREGRKAYKQAQAVSPHTRSRAAHIHILCCVCLAVQCTTEAAGAVLGSHFMQRAEAQGDPCGSGEHVLLT